MKITNTGGFPQALVRAVENDPYSPGDSDITVTALIQPPLISLLTEKHDDEIEVDVSERIWSLLGSAAHNILEQAAGQDELVEERYYIEDHGWKIGGKFDHLELTNGTLSDYKVTASYSVKDGGKDDWTKQLNILAYILEENGILVYDLRIVAILRDWNKNEAKRNRDYPQSMVVTIPIERWSRDTVKAYIRERVMLHQGCRILADSGDYSSIPECSKEERWEKPESWAVMKKGGKRAVKVHNTPEGAESHAEALGKDYYVEHRSGARVRCEGYCSASQFCRYYQESLEKKNA